MNTIIVLIFIGVLKHCQAQYSHVRYQPDVQGYPAAGFKPSGEFNLPSRQEPTNYRVPDYEVPNAYGVPADSYEVPSYTYMPPTEYGIPERTESNNSEVNFDNNDSTEGEFKTKNEVETVKGAYYVLLPGSQLQKVQFQTENDVQNMAYTARLQFRNEDRVPIFVYTAQQYQPTAAYVQFNKQ